MYRVILKLLGRTFLRKYAIPLLLSFVVMVASCARPGKNLVMGPPGEKTVVISPKKQGPGFRPYVVNGERYYPLPSSHGFVQTGKASWYGKHFHGKTTASGAVYNMYQKTGAHKTLPLGTWVRVLNLENRKQTVVKINDRGPFVKGRIIDLSYAAARDLDLIGPGTARVRLEALGRQVGEYNSKAGKEPVVEAKDLERGLFTVQVGAFRERENALRLAKRLRVLFHHVDVSVLATGENAPLYRLRVSRSTTLKQAGRVEKRLEAMGFGEAFIVSL